MAYEKAGSKAELSFSRCRVKLSGKERLMMFRSLPGLMFHKWH